MLQDLRHQAARFEQLGTTSNAAVLVPLLNIIASTVCFASCALGDLVL